MTENSNTSNSHHAIDQILYAKASSELLHLCTFDAKVLKCQGQAQHHQQASPHPWKLEPVILAEHITLASPQSHTWAHTNIAALHQSWQRQISLAF